VAYLTRALRASLGVVISASHNTFEDNGIKFFSAKGTKLPYVWEVVVEQMLLDEPHWVPAIALGKTQLRMTPPAAISSFARALATMRSPCED
jgi:phosphoglucosamine mutase